MAPPGGAPLHVQLVGADQPPLGSIVERGDHLSGTPTQPCVRIRPRVRDRVGVRVGVRVRTAFRTRAVTRARVRGPDDDAAHTHEHQAQARAEVAVPGWDGG